MKRIRTAVAAALISVAGVTHVAAQGIVDAYCTRISQNDKVASDGFRLKDAASIIRQDRANFHRFGTADRGDGDDRTFRSAAARARIPALLDNGQTDPSVFREIVRGTPRICVEIYPTYLYVYVN